MQVMVFGAQSHIGFALCEKFIEEGIEVCAILLNTSTKVRKRLLEERLMLTGRNALFREFSIEDNWRNEKATHVIYCKEDGHDQDQLCYDKSVERAVETKSDYFYVTPATIDIEERQQQLETTLQSYSIFKLPKLYGPFQPPEEKVHQHLMSILSGEKRTLTIKEPLLFITDAAETLVDIINKDEYKKVYSFLSELKDVTIDSVSVELKMNATKEGDDESVRYPIVNKISIEKGLFEQISCIKVYREIYELDS